MASPKLPLPHVLGADGSGVVDAVGPGVEGFAPGDEVVINPGLSCGRCERCLAGEDNLCPRYQILGEHRHGTYAEYVVLPEANLAPKPKSLSFEEAAAIPLTFLTAWQMVARLAYFSMISGSLCPCSRFRNTGTLCLLASFMARMI